MVEKRRGGRFKLPAYKLKKIYLLLGIFLLGSVYALSLSQTTNFLNLEGSRNLTPIGQGITSATVQTYNQTWVNFNGRNSSIYIPNNELLRFEDGIITISLWYYKMGNCASTVNTGSTVNCGLIAQSKGNTEEGGWEILHQNNSLIFIVSDGFSDQYSLSWPTTTYPWNTWTHIAFTWDLDTMRAYTNGIGVTTDFFSGNPVYASDSNFTIGMRNQVVDNLNNNYFNGSIDDVRVYRKFMDPAEVNITYKEYRQGQSVPVVNYHLIADVPTDPLVTNTSKFIEQMNWLHDNDFTCITYTDYYNYTQGRYLLPKKPVIVSFDDGYIPQYNVSFITMNSLGCVGNLHLTTGNIGNGATTGISWAQILNMSNAGWDISSHSVTHPFFLNSTIAEIIAEFNNSYNMIKGNVSKAPIMFVYPYNSRNETTDFICSSFYTMCNGRAGSQYIWKVSNLTSGGNSELSLNRIHIGNTTTLTQFANYFGAYQNLTLKLDFSENSSYTAYDRSGYGVNGTYREGGAIKNGRFQNDNVLVNVSGYALNTTTGLLTLPYQSLYNWIEVSWNYSSSDASTNTTNLTVSTRRIDRSAPASVRKVAEVNFSSPPYEPQNDSYSEPLPEESFFTSASNRISLALSKAKELVTTPWVYITLIGVSIIGLGAWITRIFIRRRVLAGKI